MGSARPVYWSQYVRVVRADGTVHEYGPYWYSWYYDAAGVRRKRYHGRADPRPTPEDVPAGADWARLPFITSPDPISPQAQEE